MAGNKDLPVDPNPEPMLAEVPEVIKTQGRVAGFEHMRDRLLTDWEHFIERGVNAYSALKLVIEMDRHAMFADVQAEKKKGQFDMKTWEDFQKYLQGEVDVTAEPPTITTKSQGGFDYARDLEQITDLPNDVLEESEEYADEAEE